MVGHEPRLGFAANDLVAGGAKGLLQREGRAGFGPPAGDEARPGARSRPARKREHAAERPTEESRPEANGLLRGRRGARRLEHHTNPGETRRQRRNPRRVQDERLGRDRRADQGLGLGRGREVRDARGGQRLGRRESRNRSRRPAQPLGQHGLQRRGRSDERRGPGGAGRTGRRGGRRWRRAPPASGWPRTSAPRPDAQATPGRAPPTAGVAGVRRPRPPASSLRARRRPPCRAPRGPGSGRHRRANATRHRWGRARHPSAGARPDRAAEAMGSASGGPSRPARPARTARSAPGATRFSPEPCRRPTPDGRTRACRRPGSRLGPLSDRRGAGRRPRVAPPGPAKPTAAARPPASRWPPRRPRGRGLPRPAPPRRPRRGAGPPARPPTPARPPRRRGPEGRPPPASSAPREGSPSRPPARGPREPGCSRRRRRRLDRPDGWGGADPGWTRRIHALPARHRRPRGGPRPPRPGWAPARPERPGAARPGRDR